MRESMAIEGLNAGQSKEYWAVIAASQPSSQHQNALSTFRGVISIEGLLFQIYLVLLDVIGCSVLVRFPHRAVKALIGGVWTVKDFYYFHLSEGVVSPSGKRLEGLSAAADGEAMSHPQAIEGCEAIF